MKRFLRSHVGRPLDPAYASNRFVMAATVAAGAVAGLVRWVSGDGDVLRWGFLGGAAAFIAWVIGREMDPDDTLTAGIATLLAVVALLAGAPGLGAAAAVMIALRVMVGTTGRSPTSLDLTLFVLAAAYLGTRPEAWVPLAGLVFAVAYDGWVTESTPARRLGAPLAMAAVGVGAAVVATPVVSWTAPGAAALVVGIVGAAAALASVRPGSPTSTADLTGHPLQHDRLIATRWAGAAMGVAAFAVTGGPGIASLGPLWAAFAALVITRVWRSRGVAAKVEVAERPEAGA